MTKIIVGIVVGIAIIAGSWWTGYSARDAQAKQEAAIAKARFDNLLADAGKAYANQKAIDDKELADLKAKATTAPPDPTIALKKGTVKRIGAVK